MTTAAMEAHKPRIEDGEQYLIFGRVEDAIHELADVVLDEPDPASDQDLARWRRLEQALAEARRQFAADGE